VEVAEPVKKVADMTWKVRHVCCSGSAFKHLHFYIGATHQLFNGRERKWWPSRGYDKVRGEMGGNFMMLLIS
jgi:hypothetical protein